MASRIIMQGLQSAQSAEQLAAVDKASVDRHEAMRLEAKERAGTIERSQTAGMPPDWLTSTAAGAGAGWIFGPVGGLLTMGLTALMSKRRRSAIAQYAAQEGATTTEALERARNQFDRASQEATTDQERAELELMRDEFETWAAASNSANPEQRATSLVKALDLAGTLDAELDEWQTERIAAAEKLQAADDRNFSRFSTLEGKLRQDSGRYDAAKETFSKAVLAYERPNPQSDMALIYLTAQMIDPGAIVTDGDSKMIKATGSLTQQMAGYLNSLIDGTTGFDDAVRDGLMSTISENYLPMRREQMERNETYQALGLEAGLEGTEYQKALQRKIDPTETRLISQFRQFDPSKAGIPVDPAAPDEFVEVEPDAVSGFLSRSVQGLEMIGEGIARGLRGEKQLVDGQGNVYVQDAEGNKQPTGEVMPQFQNADGDTILRTETADGPVFRNLDAEQRMRDNAANDARRGRLQRRLNRNVNR